MKRKTWDIREFDKTNLPEIVPAYVDPKEFSEFRGIRVLDLPLHMPGQGWKIPGYLEQFTSLITAIESNEKSYGGIDAKYIYITVDQKTVLEGKTGRRAGAHSDAYIEVHGQQIDVTSEHYDVIANQNGEVCHTYICYDCVPTEFFLDKFPLVDTSHYGSLKTFDDIANASKDIITYPVYHLLKLDPYVVHRCAIVPETCTRTFVKISVSSRQYSRADNTRNPMFNYSCSMNVRSPDIRNSPF